MSVLPICITGEPVLHRIADPVERFDSSLTDLVADMIDTMHEAPGVGLAAPPGRRRAPAFRLVVPGRRALRQALP